MRTFRPRPELPKNYQAVIDEFGALDEELSNAKIQRYNELRNAILSWFETYPNDRGCSVTGEEFSVAVTQCRRKRRIRSMTRLFKAIGEKLFLSHCEFALADADKLLSPAAQASLIAESQTGPRTLSVMPRAR